MGAEVFSPCLHHLYSSGYKYGVYSGLLKFPTTIINSEVLYVTDESSCILRAQARQDIIPLGSFGGLGIMIPYRYTLSRRAVSDKHHCINSILPRLVQLGTVEGP